MISSNIKQIPFTKFRSSISKFLNQVERTREPIALTRNGEVLVEIHPVEKRPPTQSKRRLGVMRGTAKILGDIVSPTSELD